MKCTHFYLNKCYDQSIFEKRNNSPFSYVTGHTYFPEKDFEPEIHTNPRKFPNIVLNNSDNEIFIQWMKKQYTIISKTPKNNH